MHITHDSVGWGTYKTKKYHHERWSKRTTAVTMWGDAHVHCGAACGCGTLI